ncbi:hypothetical protein BaRGS_00027528 [Batillaria attramentaria]|uniref:Uncharacterized protein n=1 Tax=Batillaria attramentaria TaxID=370345 RepID=A0ABD0K2R5_9CAEN
MIKANPCAEGPDHNHVFPHGHDTLNGLFQHDTDQTPSQFLIILSVQQPSPFLLKLLPPEVHLGLVVGVPDGVSFDTLPVQAARFGLCHPMAASTPRLCQSSPEHARYRYSPRHGR